MKELQKTGAKKCNPQPLVCINVHLNTCTFCEENCLGRKYSSTAQKVMKAKHMQLNVKTICARGGNCGGGGGGESPLCSRASANQILCRLI